VEFKRIVTSSGEGKKYGTLEREKKRSAMPRKRTGSLDKEKSRAYQSGSLERRHRGTRTPEPYGSEFKKVTSPSKKTLVGSSTPSSTYSAVLPAEVNREMERVLVATKKATSVISSSTKDQEQGNPTLKEIGKTLSITSVGSVEMGKTPSDGSVEMKKTPSDGSVDIKKTPSGGSVDNTKEPAERVDSSGSGDHKWQRKGAKRRQRPTLPASQPEFDDDEFSPRSRTRSGAVSGGGSAQRSTHNTEEDEEMHSSRSRTRSGAVSGSDAAAIRRGRNVKHSPRPAHRVVSRHRSGPSPDKDSSDFPEPSFRIEPDNLDEAELMLHAKVSRRRAGRTSGDMLVATDGERD
jgi:hypothetical protein